MTEVAIGKPRIDANGPVRGRKWEVALIGFDDVVLAVSSTRPSEWSRRTWASSAVSPPSCSSPASRARSGPRHVVVPTTLVARARARSRPADLSATSATLGGMATTRTIAVHTALPGPRSQAVLDRLQTSVASPLALTFPVVAAEGRGATLTDLDGNVFIDFAGGVGCLNVGHSHPRVVAAAQEQLERFAHTDYTVVPYEVYAELSERLLALAPFTGPAKAAFFNAGTEAVENAVKFARAFTGRPAVIAFEGAFHGRTLLSLSLTSKTHPYKAGLGPFAPEVYRVPFRTPTGARRPVRRSRRSTGRSRRSSRRRTSRRSSSSRSRARPGSSPRPPSSWSACGDLRRARDRARLSTRCRPVSRAPGGSSRSSTTTSSRT